MSSGKQKFVYGKTIAEVNAAANALMNQDTAGLEVGDHTLVGEWAKIWLKNYKSDLRAATIKMYRDSYNLHIMEQIGYMELRNVKPVHIRQVMASVASRSESLQRKVLLTMRQLFEEARLNHLIIDNPTEGIKITPHAKAEKKKALLPNEVDVLMRVVYHAYKHEFGRRTTRPRILRPLSVLRASQGRSAWVAMVGHSKQLSDRPACYDLSEQSARSRR